VFFSGALSVISGSGIGPRVAFSKAVLPTLRDTNLPAAVDLCVLDAIAANFGRTIWPVAAVLIFSTTLGIVKRTAAPLVAGVFVASRVILARVR
jgi:C4-dicarboxylate transporter